MNNAYLEVISLVERLHRHFLEVVKLELEGLGIHDINNVQGMMLFNIGVAEMTVGELTLRGCYLGSNVSYNVKPQAALSAEDLQGAGATLRRLERFWIRAGDFVQRPPQFAA